MSVTIKKLAEISDETKYKLKKKSMRFMVDSPSSKGYSPQVIKEKMTGYVLDDDDSIISIIENIIENLNEDLESIEGNINDLIQGNFELTVNIVSGTISGVSISDAIFSNGGINNSSIYSSNINDSNINNSEINQSNFKNGTVKNTDLIDVEISGNSKIKSNNILLNNGTISGGNLNNNNLNNSIINNATVNQMSSENGAVISKQYVDSFVAQAISSLETSLKEWIRGRDSDHIIDSNLNYNSSTGIISIVFERENGETITKTLDLPVEFSVIGVEADEDNNSLIFTMSGGNKFTVSIDAMFHSLTEELNDLIIIFNNKIDEINDLEQDIETSETNRQSNEANRQSNETARENKELIRSANETTRDNNEESRKDNENSRVSAENARINAENNRVSQETTRQTQESSRVNAETLRVSAENTRASNETTRQSNESTRQSNETTRQRNEETRIENEDTRNENEVARQEEEELRVQAETDRATEFATWESEIDSKADKDYVDKKDTNLQYEIADLKAKLYETVVGVKQLKTEYASEIDIPTHITEDSVAYPVLDNTAIEAATIKGHTLKWNSLYSINDFANSTMNGINFTKNNDGSITINGTATGLALSSVVYANFTKGHKYLLKGCPSGGDVSKYFLDTGANIGTDFGNGNIGTCISDTGTYYIRYYIKAGATLNNVKVFPLLIDLTDIGLDSLTTIDQVKAEILKRYNINLDTYQPYDAGSLKNVNVEKIESFTANIWDEEWELGYIDNNGQKQTSSYNICSKNFCLCVPNDNYYAKISTTGNVDMCFYDKDYNYIGRKVIYKTYASESSNFNVFAPPTNANWLKLSFENTYGTTYKHDISIYKGSTNLGYIPYKKLGSLDIPNIDLRGVNDIQDTLAFVEQENGTYNLEHTKYIDRADLGTFDYIYNNVDGQYCFMVNILNKKSVSYSADTSNLTCSKYVSTTWNNNRIRDNFDMTIAEGGTYISIRNSAYTDTTSFKAAMSGVPLDYELANPIKTVIATGLLFDEVSLLINKYGRIEVVNRSTDNVNADTTFNVAVKEFKDNE